MAIKISAELLIMILNYVQLTQDLYSSLFVSRIWCKVTIPILWKLILVQEGYMNHKELRKKALCIRTYISCMDSQSRALLIQCGFDLSSSPPQATFDYPSFTHKFRIDNLAYFISIYSQEIIGSNHDDNDISITAESRILFREICKLLINRCTFLDSFKLGEVHENFSGNNCNYNDLIGSILELPGAPKVFKRLETFVSATIKDEIIGPLYKSLTLICDNILNMDLEFNSDSQLQLLEKFISVQKRLENLSIIDNGYKNLSILDNGYTNCNSLLWVIISQKETLKSLRLNSVSFYNLEGKSSPIGQFTSLKELYIENCYGLYNSDYLFFASSLTQLSSLHLRYLYYMYPQEFIIKIFETANTNLKNICLELYRIISNDIFSAILSYCTKITELTLLDLSLEQVIAIFNNNFNELRRFSFDYNGLDANELLCQMAESVPKSLETIEIRMGIFNADSLRKFFEGWCCKGGGGNKKIIVKRTRVSRKKLFALSDEHFKVIEEYGIQFDIK
ncbi:11184_t:CDS:1 [Diversispora eburnea]|uniref:11184_t:CDS:1 n=1 Tax=Diversispora eburnea TaxID=1213867 RepID=A0A9N8ZIY5_9GLOM|nr:11184_t:CDS:1 [Diversispora eburnea]